MCQPQQVLNASCLATTRWTCLKPPSVTCTMTFRHTASSGHGIYNRIRPPLTEEKAPFPSYISFSYSRCIPVLLLIINHFIFVLCCNSFFSFSRHNPCFVNTCTCLLICVICASNRISQVSSYCIKCESNASVQLGTGMPVS